MNVKKRLARLENIVEGMQTVDPYETERYKLIRKAVSKLTEEERLGWGQGLLKWKKNSGTWAAIEHEKHELNRLLKLGLLRLTETEIQNYECLMDKRE